MYPHRATTVSSDIVYELTDSEALKKRKAMVNKIIVIIASFITYLIATQMGAILDAMQQALSLAIGTSFIVIGALLAPKFSSRKAGFWTILASIAAIITWNVVPSLTGVFHSIGIFMVIVCGIVFIAISVLDKNKITLRKELTQ